MSKNIRMLIAMFIFPLALIYLGSTSNAIGGACIAGVGWTILILDGGYLLIIVLGLSIAQFLEWVGGLFKR